MFKSSFHRKNDNSGSSSAFLIGGIIGAIGTYFFLTEKGSSTRKKIMEKAGNLSTDLVSRFNSLRQDNKSAFETQGTDNAIVSSIQDGPKQSDKAHNMINHLKQANSDAGENRL